MTIKKVIVIVVLVLVLLARQLPAQVNTDSIFNTAVLDARTGNYDKALLSASKVLEIFPERYDIQIFCANVHAWKGDYSAALGYIENAYLQNPSYEELYDTWLNVLLWSESYQKLLDISELALQNNYTQHYNVILKKAFAHKALGEYANGIRLIDNHQSYLDSVGLKTLYDELYRLSKQQTVSIYYAHDYFNNSNFKAEHLSYIDFAFKIHRHTLIPRLKHTNRFDKNDFQIELDYYHSFKSGNYLYSNYGLGIKKELFPHHKAGIEYFIPFLKSFEASLGSRYFYSQYYNTLMFTGHLSSYLDRFWLALRPFYGLYESRNLLTAVFNTRYFGENFINYWGLELTYGNSPDEKYLIAGVPEFFTLENKRVKIEKNTAIFKYSELKLSAAYSYEEYRPQNYRNRLTFEILIKQKF